DRPVWRDRRVILVGVTLAYDGATRQAQLDCYLNRRIPRGAGHSDADSNRSADRIRGRQSRWVARGLRALVRATQHRVRAGRQRALLDHSPGRQAADRTLRPLHPYGPAPGRARRAAAGPRRLVEYRDWASDPGFALPYGYCLRAVQSALFTLCDRPRCRLIDLYRSVSGAGLNIWTSGRRIPALAGAPAPLDLAAGPGAWIAAAPG